MLIFLTGCLRVSRESIFTGLNNLGIVSILSNAFDEYFGFTEKEAETALEFYGFEEKLSETKDWYNGYMFGDAVVYNPWSFIQYVQDLINKEPHPRPFFNKYQF